MAIPRSVLEQAERADALQKSLNANTEPKAPAPTDAPAPVAAAPEATPPAQQPAQQPAEQSPNPAAAPAVPVAPAAAPAVPVEDSFEVKYKVLQGKYAAEVPRFAGEIRELKEAVRGLQEENARLKAAPPAPPAIPVNSMTAETVVEKFGEDFAAAVGAVASSVAEQRTQKLRDELAPQIKKSTDTAFGIARSEFMRDLTSVVPNWKEIDSNDGFTAYLDEVDPMTGRQRREFFNEADRRNDAERVARFFKAFAAGTKSPASGHVAQVPSIESQIAPDASRSSGLTPQGKKIWRQSEIGAFYAAARQGRYSKEDFKRIESDIFAAQSERRIAA